jgi:hypothetical protein
MNSRFYKQRRGPQSTKSLERYLKRSRKRQALPSLKKKKRRLNLNLPKRLLIDLPLELLEMLRQE